MPAVSYNCDVRAAEADVWDFVADMDNWAPFLTGYQRHEKISDTESLWVLRGALGGITRIAEFRVTVDEWAIGQQVSFQMEGVNEPMTGSGRFSARSEASPGSTAAPVPAPPLPWHQRLGDWLSRAILSRIFGTSSAAAAPARLAIDNVTAMTFDLELTVRGATGPVLNLLIAPMLKPVAEDLATKIATAIEAGEGRQ